MCVRTVILRAILVSNLPLKVVLHAFQIIITMKYCILAIIYSVHPPHINKIYFVLTETLRV